MPALTLEGFHKDQVAGYAMYLALQGPLDEVAMLP